MENTKLITALNALDTWERRHFAQFIASPFYNKRQDVIDLYRFICLEYKKEGARFYREEAYRFVHAKQPFDEQVFYLMLSRLFKLLEQFLVCREFQLNEAEQKIYLAKAYQKLNLEKSFTRSLREAEKIADKAVLRDANYWRASYEREYAFYEFVSSKSRLKETNLDKVFADFDIYFLSEKMKHFCFQLSHQSVYKKEYDPQLANLLVAYIGDQKNLLQYPALAIYYFCYQALTAKEGNDTYFRQLRTLTNECKEQFEKSELRDIYLLALNYCIRQFNNGKEAFYREGFELYRSGIEQEILLDKGIISRFTFSNVVTFGLRLGEFDWVENFIEHYKTALSKNYATEIVSYNLARLWFEQQKYEDAIEVLLQFNSKDYLHILRSKTLLLKMYYERDDMDALESLLESMRVNLNRKGLLSENKKENFKHIVRFAKQLIELNPYEKSQKKKLLQAVEQSNFSEKEWFIKQLK